MLVRHPAKRHGDASTGIFHGSFLTLSKAKFSVMQGNSDLGLEAFCRRLKGARGTQSAESCPPQVAYHLPTRSHSSLLTKPGTASMFTASKLRMGFTVLNDYI